jgi:hypothetical protein
MSKGKRKPVKVAKPKVSYTQLVDPYNHSPIQVYTYGGRWIPTPGDLPSSIRILGLDFRIFYHSRIYAARKKESRLLGLVLYANRVIVLEADQPFDELKETLYHEVSHVYIKLTQRSSKNMADLTYAQTEELCDLFGQAVCDLARNNRLVG